MELKIRRYRNSEFQISYDGTILENGLKVTGVGPDDIIGRYGGEPVTPGKMLAECFPDGVAPRSRDANPGWKDIPDIPMDPPRQGFPTPGGDKIDFG